MRNDHTSRLEADGPAVIHYDPKTKNPVKEMYFADGHLHRVYGAAVVHKDAITGKIIEEEFFRFDKPSPPL